MYHICHAPYLPQRNCGYSLNLFIFFPVARIMNNTFFCIWNSLAVDLLLSNPSYFMSYIYLLVVIEFYRLTLFPWKFRETPQSIAKKTGSKNLILAKICHNLLSQWHKLLCAQNAKDVSFNVNAYKKIEHNLLVTILFLCHSRFIWHCQQYLFILPWKVFMLEVGDILMIWFA